MRFMKTNTAVMKIGAGNLRINARKNEQLYCHCCNNQYVCRLNRVNRITWDKN